MALQPFMFLFHSQFFGHFKVSFVPIQSVTPPCIFFPLLFTLALQISTEAKFTLGIFIATFNYWFYHPVGLRLKAKALNLVPKTLQLLSP